jgi:thymidylate synthase ThyX
MIKAEIVSDSLAPSGVRLTTFVLTYPRFIHAEFMTHRVFSRNASSSRAIPVKRQIQEIIDNPVIPLAFTKNQKGMQGGEALDQEAHEKAVAAWLELRDEAVKTANRLADLEVHKQYANRVMEPWAHITVVVTASEWDNWFTLRYHYMAQPEICELAKQMWDVYSTNQPENLNNGELHLPFVNDDDVEEVWDFLREAKSPDPSEDARELLIRRSVAKCARVSYKNHDGTKTTIEQDVQLYERLLGSAPIHASPAEHQAMAVGDANIRSGNFRGWIQYRKTLVGENVMKFTGPVLK